MKQELLTWLKRFGLGDSEYLYFLVVIGLIIVVSLVIHLILHRVVLRFMARERKTGRTIWQRAFLGHKLFSRIALALQGVVVFTIARAFLAVDSLALQLIEAFTHLWIIMFALLALFSLLDTVEEISRSAESVVKLPLRGIFQSLKLVATTVALIFATAFLIGKSPMILFSGLGAMTAVVLLIFKDPILGLVAGIQLSANNMLAVGDWLEMQKYGADGDVVDISLTTVKVCNWDKTITSIPSYALISDSFKNWRNIQAVGGRRLSRAINIDATSVGFASDEELKRLRRARLLSDYIEDKLAEIKQANEADGVDPSSPMNTRQLTNLGIFRAYLTAYLADHKDIKQDLTFMVRYLEAGPSGIPLQVYGFANQTSWVIYESIQSDIFDHIYAIIPEFGLRLHQAPSGLDVQRAGEILAGSRRSSGGETVSFGCSEIQK
ncbi:MAG TPA: mechanosensitive ion channel family protein [Desulfuromonadales bacterium]|nr:mechanosensitive ion channel family protein [Desulfuromonadales bacterium]